MIETPAFLDTQRPDTVPDLVISHGITPFHLAKRPVRGRLVRLGRLADIMLMRHDLPDPGRALAGEALALVAGLSAGLKFKGSFSLQIKGDGPVSMLVVDCTDSGELRFYLRAPDLDTSETPENTPHRTAKDLLGNGYFAFTVDQGAHTERHQGIVSLEGETLADMAMHYFATSEQHQCWVRLYCEKTADGWQAGALQLEKIAEEGGIASDHDSNADAWETACILGDTLTSREIFDPALSATTLIERLFGSQDVIIDRPRAVSLGCRCNRARLASVLSTFSEDDLNHMAEEGQITMNCEFCNVGFHFERGEIAR